MAILSIGAVALDISIRVTKIPEDDGFAFIKETKKIPGGSASNFSCNLVDLGEEVWQFGAVGEDAFGREMILDLQEKGVNVTHLACLPGESTLYNYVFSGEDGTHFIVANLGSAVERVNYEDMNVEELRAIDVMYTDFFSSEASLFLAEKIKAFGRKVVYNMQCTPSFMATCGVPMERIRRMCALSDLIMMGRDALTELSDGSTVEEKCQSVYEKFWPKDGLICTLGSAGAYWFHPEGAIQIAAPFVNVVNAVGAGDAFNAGLVHAYYQQKAERQDALTFANALGAFKCTRPGPRIDARRSEIDTFVSHH